MTDFSYNQPSAEDIAGFVGFAVKAFVSFCLPAFVTVLLGLDGFWTWFGAQSAFVALLVFAPMWALSYVIVAGLFRGLAMFAERLCQSAAAAIESIGSAVANILTLFIYGSGHLAVGAVKLALHPLHDGDDARRHADSTLLKAEMKKGIRARVKTKTVRQPRRPVNRAAAGGST